MCTRQRQHAALSAPAGPAPAPQASAQQAPAQHYPAMQSSAVPYPAMQHVQQPWGPVLPQQTVGFNFMPQPFLQPPVHPSLLHHPHHLGLPSVNLYHPLHGAAFPGLPPGEMTDR